MQSSLLWYIGRSCSWWRGARGPYGRYQTFTIMYPVHAIKHKILVDELKDGEFSFSPASVLDLVLNATLSLTMLPSHTVLYLHVSSSQTSIPPPWKRFALTIDKDKILLIEIIDTYRTSFLTSSVSFLQWKAPASLILNEDAELPIAQWIPCMICGWTDRCITRPAFWDQTEREIRFFCKSWAHVHRFSFCSVPSSSSPIIKMMMPRLVR